MLTYLTESIHRDIGYVDPRTVLRSQCSGGDRITIIELSRLGYQFHVPTGWNHLSHRAEMDQRLDQFSENWSGKRWTAIVTIKMDDGFGFGVLFAFTDARDAMLMRLLAPSRSQP